MPSYLHLGHNSDNLLGASGLTGFGGVVMSPVNYDPESTSSRVLPRLREESLDLVFDPQLYNPRSDMARLRAWSYFPTDFDTADSGDLAWWRDVNSALADAALGVYSDKICSPSTLPRAFDDSYYAFSNRVYAQLAERLDGTAAVPYQTVIVNSADIGRPDRAERISSITVQGNPRGVYLVVLGEVQPRQELADAESLRGLMMLVRYLERAGIPVLVSHSSSDQVLWKAAGATACSTGKYWNLRRFTRSRFEDAQDGGRQLAYYFEEGLLAFLRQGDLIRLAKNKPDTIGVGNSANEYTTQILSIVQDTPETAWVGKGWRQFLCWFLHTGDYLNVDGLGRAQAMAERAENAWQELQSEGLHLMEEPLNDGRWIRPWRIALQQFARSTR